MKNISRRNFLQGMALAGAMASGGGCRILCGRRNDAQAMMPPYGDTFRDRLWLYGHGGTAFDTPQYTGFKIPAGPVVEMNDACRYMGIPNLYVVRYQNQPSRANCAEYFKSFTDVKRIAFGVTDGGDGTSEEKYATACALRKDHPNLTSVMIDDYFTEQEIERPKDLGEFRRRLNRDGFKLSCVIYPDQEGVLPEFKKDLALCDQITIWFWYAASIPAMREHVRDVRELVGPDKALSMGVYMWDFGGARPIPDRLMRRQLDLAGELMTEGELSSLIFHPSSIVKRDIAAVRMAKAWIERNGENEWGC